jgi:tetratricopeptide (TPR) repeat protein
MMLTRWFQDWRDRRAALRDLSERQRGEEAILMDQNVNPFTLAQLSLDRDEPATSAMHWERACALVPNTVLMSPESLDILIRLQRYDEAEALMRRREARNHRDRFFRSGLARIAEARGDIAEALTRWETARDRNRDDADGYIGCARCLRALDRLDEAEQQLDLAIRRRPDHIFAHIERARISEQRQDWPESVVRWKHLAEAHGFPAGFANAAKALLQLDRADEAEAYLADPALLYPRDLEIAVTRARVAHHRGDLDATCDRWAAVRRVAPLFHTGYFDGARYLVEAGRAADADEVLRIAIERFPNELWPLHGFARLAHDRGDWNEAAARWALVLERIPGDADGLHFGAEALKAAGRDDTITNQPDAPGQ